MWSIQTAAGEVRCFDPDNARLIAAAHSSTAEEIR